MESKSWCTSSSGGAERYSRLESRPSRSAGATVVGRVADAGVPETVKIWRRSYGTLPARGLTGSDELSAASSRPPVNISAYESGAGRKTSPGRGLNGEVISSSRLGDRGRDNVSTTRGVKGRRERGWRKRMSADRGPVSTRSDARGLRSAYGAAAVREDDTPPRRRRRIARVASAAAAELDASASSAAWSRASTTAWTSARPVGRAYRHELLPRRLEVRVGRVDRSENATKPEVEIVVPLWWVRLVAVCVCERLLRFASSEHASGGTRPASTHCNEANSAMLRRSSSASVGLPILRVACGVRGSGRWCAESSAESQRRRCNSCASSGVPQGTRASLEGFAHCVGTDLELMGVLVLLKGI